MPYLDTISQAWLLDIKIWQPMLCPKGYVRAKLTLEGSGGGALYRKVESLSLAAIASTQQPLKQERK